MMCRQKQKCAVGLVKHGCNSGLLVILVYTMMSLQNSETVITLGYICVTDWCTQNALYLVVNGDMSQC